MKWFELFMWLLVAGLFTAAVLYTVSYVDVAVHAYIGAGASKIGAGVVLLPSVDVYVHRDRIAVEPGSGVLRVAPGVCAHVSNSTWWDVYCGPVNATLRGTYYVTYWFGSSLQKDYAQYLRPELFWVVVTVLLAAWILYEYYR